MLHSLKDLIGATAMAGDRKCALREAFFHIEDGRIRHLAVDLGGWLDVDEVIVPADMLEAPEGDGESWRLSLTEAALRQAPGWDAGNREVEIDMASWPPVVVGPFGHTVSPMLIYEQMRGPCDPEQRDKGDRLVRRMQHASRSFGLPVFSASGEERELLDLKFDPNTMTIQHLVVGERGLLTTSGKELPYKAIRHMAAQGTHLVVVDMEAEARPETLDA